MMSPQLEEKLEIISLVMAATILLVALYRYMLRSWRSDVDLRRYPVLLPIPKRELRGESVVEVDCPEAQSLRVELLNEEEEVIHTLHDSELSEGVHVFRLDASHFPKGDYFIRLKSKGQVDTRKVSLLG